MTSFRLLVVCLFFSLSTGAQGIVNTIAGNGAMAYGADNGPAIYTALNGYTHKLAIAPNGDWYIADSNRIRRIEAGSTIITTIAGNDSAAYGGDGGPAINARFNFICYLAFSPTGDLYITDMFNDRVRKIDMQTGIISTVAGTGTSGFGGDGGQATGAKLSHPYGVVFDRDTNMIISDISNNRVRMVDHNGIITTIAGNGLPTTSGDGGLAINAGILEGGGMCVDTANNIYVECFAEFRVRKIDRSTGMITTYAGTGVGQVSGDGGPASSAGIGATDDIAMDKNGNLYIPDYNFHVIRKVDAATGIIHTICGTPGTAGYNGEFVPANGALLNKPTKITVDSCDNVYFSDNGSNRIRRLSYDHCGELAVKTVAALSSFSLYPDPAYAELVVAGNGKIGEVVVYDMSGRVMLRLNGSSEKLKIDVSGLQSGIYVIDVNGVRGKFVKM